LDKELGNKEGEREGFVIKQIDEGTATHVVAAFDPRIAGMPLKSIDMLVDIHLLFQITMAPISLTVI
jgi:hypothetical protein